MSSIGVWDMLKLTFKVLEFKWEQRRLTTGMHAIIKTTKGSVKGIKRQTIWNEIYYSFEKIPYAKPPIGNLRFKAPEPAAPWDAVLDCTGPGDVPLQANAVFRKYKGSEDCLYVNVFTKHLTPDKLRPVMVWLYGGGFQIGEATRDMYSPDFFMSKDIVLVTVSYRLNAFGFLSFDDPDLNIPGNAGIKDQILSLKWVKENISVFGGDPNNITLFGESAGGASTHLCMVSDQSRGLINKAIVMSGCVLCPWANIPHYDWAFRLAKALGYDKENKDCEVLKFLQLVHGPDIIRALPKILTKEEKHDRILFAFGPRVEPYITEQCVLKEDPREMLKTSWSNDIPLMIGGTSFEGLLFMPEVTRRPATLNEVGDCSNLLPFDIDLKHDAPETAEYAARLKKAYFGDEDCSPKTMMNFLDIETYREFWHPIYRVLLLRLQHATAPTLLYRFDFDSREGNSIRNILCGKDVRGCCHGDDLCYLYWAMFSHRPQPNSIEEHVIKTMIDIWTSFAMNSDPNCDMLKEVKFLPLENNSEIKCLNISDEVKFIDLPELEKFEKVWNSFYPKGKL